MSSGNRGLAQYAGCWVLVQTTTTDCDVATENSDGDHFFCAATGNDFAGIFQAAFTQLLKNSKFIRRP